MKTRVITGAILAIVFIPLFIIGELPLYIALALLTLGASYELFRMYNIQSDLPKGIMGLEMLLALGLYMFFTSYINSAELSGITSTGNEWFFIFIIFVVVIGALMSVFCEKFSASNFGEMLVIVIYPAIGFGAIYALRFYDLHNIGFLFAITIFTDVFAYIVGINFGKHRLAVKISPKKSWEGSFGGTFFAVVFTMIYIYAFKVEFIGQIELNIVVSILLIVFISIVGQIGDLVASKLKRSYGIKDFSQLFPGHGGVMDRFDSVLFAGMVLLLVSKVVGLL
jgi:phosphatidate cytidylyltransferase